MAVRKRTWVGPNGEGKEAWIVDYRDRDGRRHIETFTRKKDADDRHINVKLELGKGIHTPNSKSPTVADAGELWIASGEQAGLEITTLDQYRQHLKLHLTPTIGAVKLSQLTVPVVRALEDQLRVDRSAVLVRKIIGSLGAILADAQERGLVTQNVVRNLRSRRRRGKERQAEKRHKGKLKIGVDIPSPDEIRAIVASCTGRWRPLFLTAIFAGLRASELRGLRWIDVDLKRSEIHVRQRADRRNEIGPPKSEAGERTIPLPPTVVSALREWKLACPKGELGLVFPNGRGRVENYSNIVKRGLAPIQIEAKVVTTRGAAKYTGLHSLRHFYASWCINRRVDGGLELPLKLVQAHMGHASIQMTADLYGHLFPRGDASAELAAAERAFFGG